MNTPNDSIWNIRPLNRQAASNNAMSRRVYRMLLRWVPFAVGQYEDWDGRDHCGYFFGGSYWYGYETADVVQIFAVLSQFGEYDASVTGISRQSLKELAIRGIRYLGFTHDTGPADCVRVKGRIAHNSEKKWGGANDNFFMASQTGRPICEFGMAAWLLWHELDDETKKLVQNTVAYYADKYCAEPPRNGTYFDTQCEENAWTCQGISAAVALFPDHPHHEKWRMGMLRWAMNTATTYQDRFNEETYMGRSLRGDWISCVTLHPDYTTENHGFVHPSYLCAGINIRAYHAIFGLMSDQSIDEGVLYNNDGVYQRAVKPMVQFDGLAIPVQGQDWWYNRQHERQLTHAVMNVLMHDPDAAALENRALDIIENIQLSHKNGCFLEENGMKYVIREGTQSAWDMEHHSAQDLLSTYLLHLFGGEGMQPTEHSALAKKLAGVYEFPNGGFVIHRTEDQFTSMALRNNVMALHMPKEGMWTITALFSSYTGHITMDDAQGTKGLRQEQQIREAADYCIQRYEDGFGAKAVINRGGKIAQHIALISLPDGTSVYIESIQAIKQVENVQVNTGMIGIRNESYEKLNELAKGHRKLYVDQTEHTFDGFYGKQDDHFVNFAPAAIVNIDHRMGYVLNGSHGITYLNRHRYDHWKGVEDIISLNVANVAGLKKGERLPTFTVLTIPNATREDTCKLSQRTAFAKTDDEDVSLLYTGIRRVFANFHSHRITTTDVCTVQGDSVPLFAGTNVINQKKVHRTSLIEADACGFETAVHTLQADFSKLNVQITVTQNKIIFENARNEECLLTLNSGDNRIQTKVHLEAKGCQVMNYRAHTAKKVGDGV